MITAASFLPIEAALSQLIMAEARKVCASVFSRCDDAVGAGDFVLAESLLRGLSFQGMFADRDEPLLYLTNVAMLFGASMVTQQPGTSVVGLGFEAMASKQLVLTLLQMIRGKATEYILNVGQKWLQASSASYSPTPPAPSVQKEEPSVLRPFSSFMDGAGKEYFNIVSSLHTSRVSAYGFTSEANALDIFEYQLNEQLDSRTCPVCMKLHGRVFKVEQARSLLEAVTRVTDPEELKALQPWPSQSAKNVALIEKMTADELVARGWHIPPFHPRCRGLLGRVGKVPSLAAIESGKANEKYVAGPSDFKHLGIKANKEMLSTWNSNIPIPPAEVVARLSGSTTEELLAKTFGSKTPYKAAGLKKFSFGESIDISVSAPGFGSDGLIHQQVSFGLKAKDLSIIKAKFPKGTTPDTVKKYLLEAYTVAKDTGMASLTTTASGVEGGYAYAKYGFKPSAEGWDQLKARITMGMKENNVAEMFPSSFTSALKSILASTDPASIFLLADMPLGQLLLSGLTWKGSLFLADGEAVTRFLTYIGGLK